MERAALLGILITLGAIVGAIGWTLLPFVLERQAACECSAGKLRGSAGDDNRP